MLLPDDDGHYRSEAVRLDRESHRAVPAGRHAHRPGWRAQWRWRRPAGASFRAPRTVSARWPWLRCCSEEARAAEAVGGLPGLPHFAPKAKRCIYLHLVGAPPQMETFDYKPKMQELFDKDLPESIRNGQRLTTMTSGQSRFPIAPSIFKFAQYGKSGAWMTELLPYTAPHGGRHRHHPQHAHRGHQSRTGHHLLPDRLHGCGAALHRCWLSYGLGSMNQNLPTFVVLQAKHNHPKANVQAISARLWSAGFLSGQYVGREPAQRGRPRALHQQSRGSARRSAAPHAGRAGRNEPAAIGATGRSRDSHAHRAVRDGVSHAGFRAGVDGHQQGTREHLEDVRRGRAQPRHRSPRRA